LPPRLDADPFNLQRFVDAQEPVIDAVRSELRAGRKRTHWMWFVFPQIDGLGDSAMSRTYAIRSLREAKAYLEHPVLGARLRECADLVSRLTARSLVDIFGRPDCDKFRSCVTLFSAAAPDDGVFLKALNGPCGGEPDQMTLARLSTQSRDS
jgi:uncharacterized protein (DUF1810 family)